MIHIRESRVCVICHIRRGNVSSKWPGRKHRIRQYTICIVCVGGPQPDWPQDVTAHPQPQPSNESERRCNALRRARVRAHAFHPSRVAAKQLLVSIGRACMMMADDDAFATANNFDDLDGDDSKRHSPRPAHLFYNSSDYAAWHLHTII